MGLSTVLAFFPIPVIIAIVIMGIAERWRLRGSGPVLVLKKFSINENAKEGPILVIQGRPSGIVSWLLTTAGLSPETSLVMTAHDLCIEGNSLFGFRAQY